MTMGRSLEQTVIGYRTDPWADSSGVQKRPVQRLLAYHQSDASSCSSCSTTYPSIGVTNAEAWFNNSLRPRKPEGSLGRTAQDGHLDSHTAPELCVDLGQPFALYAWQELGVSILAWCFDTDLPSLTGLLASVYVKQQFLSLSLSLSVSLSLCLSVSLSLSLSLSLSRSLALI